MIKYKIRSIRIDDELWEILKAETLKNKISVSSYIRMAIVEKIKG